MTEPTLSYPRIGLLIDGEWIYDRPTLCNVENPSTEAIIGTVPKATEDDLNAALASSARGFEVWRKTSPSERAALMRRGAAPVPRPAEGKAPASLPRTRRPRCRLYPVESPDERAVAQDQRLAGDGLFDNPETVVGYARHRLPVRAVLYRRMPAQGGAERGVRRL